MAAPIYVGTRVRVSERCVYPNYHGREGVVVNIPARADRPWIDVLFDDNPEHPASWHRSWFEALPPARDDSPPPPAGVISA
jgi:hypothetical protein